MRRGFLNRKWIVLVTIARALPIVRTVAKSEAFIPGYWRAEAVPFAVDAYVFDFFLQKLSVTYELFINLLDSFRRLPTILMPSSFSQKCSVKSMKSYVCT